MTDRERQEQVLLSLALGPIFPLHGVVENGDGALACSCGDGDCKCAGKHPMWRNYQRRATSDPERVNEWFGEFPTANYGIMTGSKTIALDADVRSDVNGLLTLEYLEFDERERLPYTVEVVTGRENGSRHFYFLPPEAASVRTRAKVLPGLDIRAEAGYCVAPGSRHVAGGFYRFADDCRPDEQAVAALPGFLLAEIADKLHKRVIRGSETPDSESVTELDTPNGEVSPALPDNVVLGVLVRDSVARFYWGGGRRNRTASEDDFALACKLAFYCRHNLRQMYRLFFRSGLYRPKFEEPRPGGNYALWTLKRAIEATPETWIRKRRRRPSVATGARKGRKTLPCTQAILGLHRQEPLLTKVQIASRLDVTPKQVRDAIRYHGRHEAENTRTLIHSRGIQNSRGMGNESPANNDLVSVLQAA